MVLRVALVKICNTAKDNKHTGETTHRHAYRARPLGDFVRTNVSKEGYSKVPNAATYPSFFCKPFSLGVEPKFPIFLSS